MVELELDQATATDVKSEQVLSVELKKLVQLQLKLVMPSGKEQVDPVVEPKE